MKLVFCGTPRFAVPTLKQLLTQTELEVAAVITQPDRPSGRGMQVSFSPVKQAALAAGISVHQPEKIRTPEAQEMLQGIAPDCIVIIAYGQIIPARLLPIPKLGWINLHASLLPKYRGAAPINWAIVNGETSSGLTTMRIDAGMDTGDMLLQIEMVVGPRETTPELAERMAEAGAPLMVETLRGIAAGTLPGRPQNQAGATFAPLLKKEDGRIDWGRPVSETYNRMRGFTPWPGAYTRFRGQTCHIVAEPVSNDLAGAQVSELTAESGAIAAGSGGTAALPGTLRLTSDALFVACGGATELRVLSVKQEGGKQVAGREFAARARLTDGERFGDT